MTDYKTHARGKDDKTLCGLSLIMATKHGPQKLPLASWPAFIECRNCLTIHYQDQLSRPAPKWTLGMLNRGEAENA